MSKKFVVGPSPHIRSPRDIDYIMWDVVVALVPATIASIIIFGWASAIVLSLSLISALFFEWLVVSRKPKISAFLGDGSAAVTGLLLGLSLPPATGMMASIGGSWTLPWAVPILGSAVAILIGKHAFGGLGKNPFNPALVGRGFLTFSYLTLMTNWEPTGTFVDTTTGATPLQGEAATLWELFIGTVPGSLGETSALALIIGGIYLLYKGHIDWRIPGGFLGAMVVFSFIHTGFAGEFEGLVGFLSAGLDEALFQVLSGSALMGAIYMATCYVTSPTTKNARLIYGIGCGLILILIRYYAQAPAGLTYAVLFMNALTPILDRLTIPRTFGEVK
ncbi:RnfABCDGE type electron transport complex subunit D [Proteinivorax tanatarense]|uniref:Ion-translocating oxidoreductase complex subunit D n=1 Tax=Proteinivorax tanatarense TaxID=1260629 RepID=A0AAU7VIF0_9FIRM